MNNRVKFQDLLQLTCDQVADLSVEELSMLMDDLATEAARVKRMQDNLHGALLLKYGPRLGEKRFSLGKDTGTAAIEDGDFVVASELPKRVEWDQRVLAKIYDTLLIQQNKAAEFVEVELSVPERRYTVLPSGLQEMFKPARTVKTGKPTFKIARQRAA